MVEVLKNDSLVDSKRTDAFGKAEFRMIGSRYTAAGQDRQTGYKAVAHDDRLRFSRNQSCEMTQDQDKTLILIEKNYAPHCTISSPDAKITPIIDASQFLKESGASDPLLIEGDAVPIHPDTRDVARLCGEEAMAFAMSGGEDFELLFAISPRDAPSVTRAVSEATGTPITVIGEAAPPEQGIRIRPGDGTRVPLADTGYAHFRRRESPSAQD
jgi:hypothetical protein